MCQAWPTCKPASACAPLPVRGPIQGMGRATAVSANVKDEE